MTDTTTEAIRVYVRRLGYATLLEIHDDRSATVRLGDTMKRIPFGDWAYDRNDPAAETNSVEIKARIQTALQLDFGDDFAVVSSGVGPGLASYFAARYGQHVVHIQVAPDNARSASGEEDLIAGADEAEAYFPLAGVLTTAERPPGHAGRVAATHTREYLMTDLSGQDIIKAIEAARALDAALLPLLGTYHDGSLINTTAQAWKDADADAALRKTRDTIDRALTNLKHAP